MTDQHPITPPPELWKQLAAGAYTWKEAVTYAYRAGADDELEACCEWLVEQGWFRSSNHEGLVSLRAARRPKPPSLKEQAHEALGRFFSNAHTQASQMTQDFEIIRRAVEQLDD